MSFPNIPNITPAISITTAQTIPLLLSSIVLEELALAHIINAEAEKLQFVLGTLPPGRTTLSPPVVTVSNLLTINSSVQRTLRDVIKKEILLEFKFENVLDLLETVTTVTLNVDPTTICTSGKGPNTSTLTGQVLVGGSPPPAGTPIFFTVDNSVLGTVAPNIAVTDAFGNFTATFTAINGPGTVTITATALGGVSDAVTTTIIDNCNVLFFATIGATSDTVCSSGTGPNTITVSGELLVDGGVGVTGIPVEFSVDNPLLASVSPATTTTDASGNFSTTFTAIDGPGIVAVTATFPTVAASALSIDITIIDC